MYRIMSFITLVRFLSLSKLEAIAFNRDLERGFILNVIRTNSGIALMMLSTIVTVAAREVRDIGLRSIAITILPAFLSASARSPSSRGTNTTSASPIPFASTLRLRLATPGILSLVGAFTPSTWLAPLCLSKDAILRSRGHSGGFWCDFTKQVIECLSTPVGDQALRSNYPASKSSDQALSGLEGSKPWVVR